MAIRYNPQRALTPDNPAGGSQVVIINNLLGFAGTNAVVWGILGYQRLVAHQRKSQKFGTRDPLPKIRVWPSGTDLVLAAW